MQSEICNLQSAICNLQCNLQSAIYNLQSHDPVVNLQIGPVAVFPAAVFETIFQ
jgi:hypothetical protein